MYYLIMFDENGEQHLEAYEDFWCAVDEFKFALQIGIWARVCLFTGSDWDLVHITE